MNLRSSLYFNAQQLIEIPLDREYQQTLKEEYAINPEENTQKRLMDLLSHCQRNVPYYSSSMAKLGKSCRIDPAVYPSPYPILTKDTIRQNFEQLKSSDLARRKMKLMGSDCVVKFDFAECIPPSSSGKYRYSISKVLS